MIRNSDNTSSLLKRLKALCFFYEKGYSEEFYKILSQIRTEDLCNFRDENGNTLLHIACQNLFTSDFSDHRISALIERGLDPKTKNNDGNNALMVMGDNIYYKMYKILEHKRKSLNASNFTGRSYETISVGSPINKIFSSDKDQQDFDLYMGMYKDTIKRMNEGYKAEFTYHFVISREFVPDQQKLEELKNNLKQTCYSHIIKIMEKHINHFVALGLDINDVNNAGECAVEIFQKIDSFKPDFFLQPLLARGAKDVNRFKKLAESSKYNYLLNEKDERNISSWYGIPQGICNAIKNRNLGKYPWAKLNTDNSISLFIDPDIENQWDLNVILRKKLPQEFFSLQLEYLCSELGFNIVGDGPVIEINESEFCTEYKINISPYNLDTIMKKNSYYVGYRNNYGSSILALNREFELKEGTIMLFPIASLDKQHYNIGAAGCQLYEMPSLQLMKLLPNYESEIKPQHAKNGFSFHWIPGEVYKSLNFSRDELEQVMSNLLRKSDIEVTSQQFEYNSSFCEGADKMKLCDNHETHNSLLKFNKIDPESENFYLLYGNLSIEELQPYLSCEVSIANFVSEVANILNQKDNLSEEQKNNLRTLVENHGPKPEARQSSHNEILTDENSNITARDSLQRDSQQNHSIL